MRQREKHNQEYGSVAISGRALRLCLRSCNFLFCTRPVIRQRLLQSALLRLRYWDDERKCPW